MGEVLDEVRALIDARYCNLRDLSIAHQYARLVGGAESIIEELLAPEQDRTWDWKWRAERWLQAAREPRPSGWQAMANEIRAADGLWCDDVPPDRDRDPPQGGEAHQG